MQDIDAEKIAGLERGEIPIYEPGLSATVKQNVAAGRLRFTTDASKAVAFGTLQFIAVGTPPDGDGSADLQYVLAVANTIGEHMNDYKVVINNSTVPVGTADRVKDAITQALETRNDQVEFNVCSNPEFLKEGAAIEDFSHGSRIIVGTDSERVKSLMRECYAPYNRLSDKLMLMDVRAAELTKYAASAMLATKISFMNEIANLAENWTQTSSRCAAVSVRTRGSATTSFILGVAMAVLASPRTFRPWRVPPLRWITSQSCSQLWKP